MVAAVDFVGAIKHNRDLKLGQRSPALDQIFALLLAEAQERRGLTADGRYRMEIERALKQTIAQLGAATNDNGPLIALPGCILGLTVDAVEKRWERISQLAIVYALSAGGKDPMDIDPRSTVDRDGAPRFGLDCSGASAYALGLPRRLPTFPLYGGYMNTDSICDDAENGQSLYMPSEVKRGALLVFPGIDLNHDGKRDRIGHVAWINRVLDGFDPRQPDYSLVEIYDCAGSNSNLPGAKGDVALHRAHYFDAKEHFRGKTDQRWATRAVWCKAIAA